MAECKSHTRKIFVPFKYRRERMTIKGEICQLADDRLQVRAWKRAGLRPNLLKGKIIESWRPKRKGKFRHTFATKRIHAIRMLTLTATGEGRPRKEATTFRNVEFKVGKKGRQKSTIERTREQVSMAKRKVHRAKGDIGRQDIRLY